MSPRLIHALAAEGAGRVRVTWSAEWQEFTVRALATDGRTVAEYFTDDKADALATARHMLGELTAQAAQAA